jgi:glycosyltransferase involved in cell wall biosynthesis
VPATSEFRAACVGTSCLQTASTGRVVRPIRVAFVMDYFGTPSGGTESQLIALIRGLDRSGFDPSAYLLRPPNALSSVLPELPVQILGIGPLASLGSIARLVQFARELKTRGVDLAHLYFNDASVALPWLLRCAGLSVIVSRRDLGYWYTPLTRAALRAQRFAVAAVVANCSAVRERVVQVERYKRDVVHVIHNGKDSEQLSCTRDQARRVLGLPPESPLLLVVANLRPLKRVEDVVAALPAVRASFPAAELLLVGSDHDGRNGPSHAAEVRVLAARLGLQSAVRIVGEVPDPRLYLAAADVCLLCSETEGLSNSLIEYMLAGRPIVATRVGGNCELIRHGFTGTLVEVGQPAAIAAAVIGYLENPARAREIGGAARSWARARFSVRSMVDAHANLYESMLNG